MNPRKLLVLVAAVCLLLVVIIVKKTALNRDNAGKNPEIQQKIIDELPASFIKKISVYYGADKDKGATLVKKDNGWIVENIFGAKAKKELVEGLLQDIDGLKGELRAQTRAVFNDFHITDEESVHLVFLDQHDVAMVHLVISAHRPRWGQNFVRTTNFDKVYMCSKDFLARLGIFGGASEFTKQVFADMRPLEVKPEDVSAIAINNASGALRSKGRGSLPEAIAEGIKLTKENGTWKMANLAAAEELDTAKVDEWVRKIAALSATALLDPSANSYGLEKPSLAVSITTKNGAVSIESGTYDKNDRSYPVRILPDNLVYRIPAGYIEGIPKEKSFFLAAKQKPAKK